VCERRQADRYRSLRPRRPTDERVMPIRFGYHGRLAGTYEKISFPACVTTNWYEATLLLCAPRCSFSIFYHVFLLCHRKMANSRRGDVWIALVSHYSEYFSNTCLFQTIRFHNLTIWYFIHHDFFSTENYSRIFFAAGWLCYLCFTLKIYIFNKFVRKRIFIRTFLENFCLRQVN
jgi:hypothetical protein